MRGTLGVPGALVKAAAGAALFVGLGGAAYAATTSSAFVASDGAVTSCLPPNGGTVHIWKPGHRCSGGWANLSLAAKAGVGATGATGATNPNATAVDGQSVSKLYLKQPTPTSTASTATLYSANGLTILAQCSTAGGASLDATGPSSGDSELLVSGRDATGSYGSQIPALGATAVPIALAGSGEFSFTYATSAGAVASGNVGYQSAPSFAHYAGCGFFGEVTAG